MAFRSGLSDSCGAVDGVGANGAMHGWCGGGYFAWALRYWRLARTWGGAGESGTSGLECFSKRSLGSVDAKSTYHSDGLLSSSHGNGDLRCACACSAAS